MRLVVVQPWLLIVCSVKNKPFNMFKVESLSWTYNNGQL